jgi:hypothetical protein
VPAASKKHSGELLEHLSNVQAVEERQSAYRQIDVLIRPEQMPEIAFKGSPPGTLTRTAASILDSGYVDRRSSEKEASGQARCTETADMSAAVAGAVDNASSAYSAGPGCAARPVALPARLCGVSQDGRDGLDFVELPGGDAHY